MDHETDGGFSRVSFTEHEIVDDMLSEARRQAAERDAYAQLGRTLSVDELFVYEPAVFVRLAYGLIYHREPASDELSRQLRRLHEGLPPLELLRELRFSRHNRRPRGRIRGSRKLWQAQLGHLFRRFAKLSAC